MTKNRTWIYLLTIINFRDYSYIYIVWIIFWNRLQIMLWVLCCVHRVVSVFIVLEPSVMFCLCMQLVLIVLWISWSRTWVTTRYYNGVQFWSFSLCDLHRKFSIKFFHQRNPFWEFNISCYFLLLCFLVYLTKFSQKN